MIRQQIQMAKRTGFFLIAFVNARKSTVYEILGFFLKLANCVVLN
jgi:formate dehydrogenase assembly factor FdhD